MKRKRRKYRRTYRFSYRLTAALLCLCMVATMFGGLGLGIAMPVNAAEDGSSGPTTGVTKREADPSTMDTYREMLDLTTNSRYAGRLWTDKTVFANGQDYTSSGDGVEGNSGRSFKDNKLSLTPGLDGVEGSVDASDADFLEVLSVLGSSEEVNDNVTAPMDVIFLLDMSGSMATDVVDEDSHDDGDKDDGLRVQHSRIYKTLDSINQAIDYLMELNPTNRAAVIGYGAVGYVLLPLDHYTTEEKSADGYGIYLKAENFRKYIVYGGGKIDGKGEGSYTVHAKAIGSEKKEIEKRARNDYSFESGVKNQNSTTLIGFHTDLQDGIYTGFNELYKNLTDTESVTYTYTSDLTGVKKTISRIPIAFVMTDGGSNLALGDSTNITGDEWHSQKNTQITQAWNWYTFKEKRKYRSESTNSNGEGVILDILLTASYMKSKVLNKYKELLAQSNVSEEEKKPHFSIHSISVDTPNVNWQIPRVYATLDPKDYFNDDPPGLPSTPKDKTWSLRQTVIDAYKKWGEWQEAVQKNLNFVTTKVDDEENGSNFPVRLNVLPKDFQDDGLTITNQDIIDNINYNDSFEDIETSDLTDTFKSLIQTNSTPIFTPVDGTNDLGVDNGITFMDPIGEYMEVKDVKSMTLFGKQYQLSKTAIYDYQFNDEFMNHGKNDPFPDGWYRRNANGEIIKSTGNESWEDGWEYHVGTNTAKKFLPTESHASIENPDPKIQNTTFTFYRINDNNANELSLNPAYASEDEGKNKKLLEDAKAADEAQEDKSNSAHLSTEEFPGVYALSDLRIWVEDTGDYNDNLDGVESDTNYSEALWVNVPSNMLPLRRVTVSQASDESGEITYTTNIPEDGKEVTVNSVESASFPLRVFYTVGVENEILNMDGTVNIASNIGAEYLKDNRVTTEAAEKARDLKQGDLEFFSNWYNPENRYGDYATTTTHYSYGDPVVSFSPSTSNRYYIFQKALPLYRAAWQYNGSEWEKVNIGNSDGQISPTEFGGKIVGIDLVPDSENSAGIQGKLADKEVSQGDVVLLKNDRLTDVTYEEPDPFSSDGYYFMPIDYFTNTEGKAEIETYAVTRKGSEFGSGYKSAGITNGDMLCWHDVSGENMTDYPYLSYTETKDKSRGKDYIGAELDPATGYYKDKDKAKHQVPDDKTNQEGLQPGEWVVSAKPGGLRVGALAQAIGEKNKGEDGDTFTSYDDYERERFPDKVGESDFTVGYYAGNTTRTANNYYMPTISTASSEQAGGSIKVNAYLGNNGRLVVQDTTLLLTKLVVDPSGKPILDGTSDSDKESREFNYQVFIDGFTGPKDAIVVRYENGTWQRQFHYIDMNLNTALFLQNPDGSLATFDESGSFNANGNYHVYIGYNVTEGTGSEKTAMRVYHNEDARNHESDEETKPVSGNDIIVETDENTGKKTFFATKAWLFTKTQYENFVQNFDPNTSQKEDGSPNGVVGENFSKELSKFELLTLDPSASWDGQSSSTDVNIVSSYQTKSEYWTETVYFGYKKGATQTKPEGWEGSDPPEDGIYGMKLTENDLYDQKIPSDDRKGFEKYSKNSVIAGNTAEVTLTSGYGLLFSGIPTGTNYRFTEQLTDKDISDGYTLESVKHNQQFGSWNTYKLGRNKFTDLGAKVYDGGPVKEGGEEFYHSNALLWESYATFKSGETGNHHGDGNPNCKGNGADKEMDGSTRHYFVRNGELIDTHYEEENEAFHANRYVVGATAHFDNDQHAYSVFGDTGAYEEGGHYSNIFSDEKTETHINGNEVKPADPEKNPNEYPGVHEGDEITYEIKWINSETDDEGKGIPAEVTIIDPLDEGVDFVSAKFGELELKAKVTEDEGDTGKEEGDKEQDQSVSTGDGTPRISYDQPTHTVTWELGSQDAGKEDKVTLTVRVNSKASLYWDYDMDGQPDEKVPDDQREHDFLVRNRAAVRVTDNLHYTNTVTNPVGEPDKTETNIEHAQDHPGQEDKNEKVTEDGENANLLPGNDGKYHGPMVYPGDVITYEISWRNYKNVPAEIVIRDQLDPNVEFVSATEGGEYKESLSITSWDETSKTMTDKNYKHIVLWNLGEKEAEASGTVELTVKVLDSATPVGYVDNTAYVAVNGDPEQDTKTIENPTPHQGKEEMTPGDGVLVGIGQEITYKITWHNFEEKPANIQIMDVLDPGVDFVSASDGGEYKAGFASYQDGNMVSYQHLVVWELGEQPSNASGEVTLTVRVNEKAIEGYEYNNDASALNPNGTTDYEVFNQARVKVGDNPYINTDIVENPVPDKDETYIEHVDPFAPEPNPEMKPREGEDNTVTGPLVYVGDEIVYSIYWKNREVDTSGKYVAAKVTITDPLDEGVDFVEGSFITSPQAPDGILPSYDKDAHTVIWSFIADPKTEGILEFRVKVNEKATPVGVVDNQAHVKVGDHPAVDTEIIENPTPKVEKTEVSPGEGMHVMPGDEIDYEISWRNYEEETAYVVVTDKLDPGVDFLSASYLDNSLSNPESTKKPEKANLTIALDGTVEGEKEFSFDLSLTPPEGSSLDAQYPWEKSGSTQTQGTWSVSDTEITLKPGQSLTVKDLPVGTAYTLTRSGDEENPIVTGTLGVYGSTVKVTVSEQEISQPDLQVPVESDGSATETEAERSPVTESTGTGSESETEPSSETVPESETETMPGTELEAETELAPGTEAAPGTVPEVETETAPGTEQAPGTAPESETVPESAGTPSVEPTSDSTGNATEPQSSEQPSSYAEPDGAIIYTFSAVTIDAEAPSDAMDAGDTAEDQDPNLAAGEPVVQFKGEDAYGEVIITYYTESHQVVWELKNRPANASGVVHLKVRVNEDAEKFWSYDNPDWGPSVNDRDDRVRNQAGVKVGDNPEVKTRIIENPTEPEKTEIEINDTDVSRDVIADESGYVGPEVHVGDTITYRIVWQNNASDDSGQPARAVIQITDPLDPGVDFVEASDGGTYDAATHTVTWNLGGRAPRERGFVTLKVRVNEKALDQGNTGEVENVATVTVGNESKQTDRVENPVEESVELTVTKTVTCNNGDKNKLFHFTVTLNDPTVNGVHGDMTFVHGVAEFTLRDGESKTATGLPPHVSYQVVETEANQDGYQTTVPGDLGITPENGGVNADFTNALVIDQDLVVTKTVTGSGDKNKEFHFTVTLGDRSVNGTYGGMTFTDGVAEFTLRDGESKTASGLPDGVTYTVTEAEANKDGYTTEASGATGTLREGVTAKADFVNDKPDTPPDTPPETPDTPPDTPDTPDTPPDTPDTPDTPPDTPDTTPDTPDTPPDDTPPATPGTTPNRPSGGNPPPDDVPKTGDGSHPELMMMLMVCSFSAIVAILGFSACDRRRSRRRHTKS